VPAQAAAETTLKNVQSEEEFGALLLALVAAARERDWDAEAALRQAVRMRIAVIQEGER
jgi:uncharacterized protein YabN with tetrapyrrole methylase and pyrophosphatase domain